MWECTLCWPPLLNVKTIFLPLFLKESINQILASNKDFMGVFLCVIFLFQFEKIPCGRGRKAKNQVGLAYPWFAWLYLKVWWFFASVFPSENTIKAVNKMVKAAIRSLENRDKKLRGVFKSCQISRFFFVKKLNYRYSIGL